MKTINKKVVGYLQMATTEITSPEDNFIWIDDGHIYVRLSGTTYQLDQQSGGTGGGHVILDNGTAKTQRTKLNLKGFTVTDDSVNDATVVEIELPSKTSDLTNDSGFITTSALSGYELLSNKSTSTSLGTSDTLYPTQNAVKSYVDTGLSGKQNTIGYTPEDQANKENTTLDTSTTKYPTNRLVKEAVDAKQDSLGFTPENVANKTTTITGNESSNTKYPTVKAMYDWSTGLFATQSSLTGYVPTSRTITINGTTQDLSSNRSWTIPSGVSSLNTLTGSVSIKAGSGIDINISGSDIEITNTGSGINIDGGVSNSTYGTLSPIDGGVA